MPCSELATAIVPATAMMNEVTMAAAEWLGVKICAVDPASRPRAAVTNPRVGII